MGNILFRGLDADGYADSSVLDCHANKDANIFMEITRGEYFEFIELDIETAISFRKHLAKQIAIAKEVNNG